MEQAREKKSGTEYSTYLYMKYFKRQERKKNKKRKKKEEKRDRSVYRKWIHLPREKRGNVYGSCRTPFFDSLFVSMNLKMKGKKKRQ